MLAHEKHSVSIRLSRGKAQLDHFNGSNNSEYLVARAVLERGIGPGSCDELVALFDAQEWSLRLSATLAPCADVKTMLIVDARAWCTESTTDCDHEVTMNDLKSVKHGGADSNRSNMYRKAVDALTHMIRVEVGAFWSLDFFDGSPWHRSAIDLWQRTLPGKAAGCSVLSICREARDRRGSFALGHEPDLFSTD